MMRIFKLCFLVFKNVVFIPYSFHFLLQHVICISLATLIFHDYLSIKAFQHLFRSLTLKCLELIVDLILKMIKGYRSCIKCALQLSDISGFKLNLLPYFSKVFSDSAKFCLFIQLFTIFFVFVHAYILLEFSLEITQILKDVILILSILLLLSLIGADSLNKPHCFG